ncbi:MAG: ribosome rescue protein RqcH, partial [Methermicoccaceae archaeon]
KDGEAVDCVPIDLMMYEEMEKQYYDTMNDALDAFFKPPVEMFEGAVKREVKSPLEVRLERQLATLEEYESRQRLEQARAESLYAHYSEVEAVLNAIREGLKNHTWRELMEIAKKTRAEHPEMMGILEEIDPREKTVRLKLGNYVVDVGLDGINAASQRYYARAKRFAKKIEGARAAITETRRVIEKSNVKPTRPSRFSASNIPRKKAWYERFRWFISSDDILVVGGRGADTNEELYSKYMEKRDLVLHAQAHGAPLTIIKTEGKEVPETTITEAAIFAVSYSNVWKAGQYEGECYLVLPHQVTKTPESGEYIAKGSFVIRGERRYLSVPVGLCVGVEENPLRLIGGPTSAIKSHASIWFRLLPGELAHNDLSRKIYRQLIGVFDDKKLAKRVASSDKITAFLPPGTSSVVEEHID